MSKLVFTDYVSPDKPPGEIPKGHVIEKCVPPLTCSFKADPMNQLMDTRSSAFHSDVGR